MKITITTDMKKVLTISEMPIVRQVIESLKDDNSLKDYAKMAAGLAACGSVEKVLECSAEIAKNCRADNNFFVGSSDLDVWITFTAYTSEGFVMGGAYLTDIWNIGSDDYEIRKHMFVRMFRESR
jgi:hypothetical protein